MCIGWMDIREMCMSLLERPTPNTTGWVAYTVEIHFVNKGWKAGCRRGRCLVRPLSLACRWCDLLAVSHMDSSRAHAHGRGPQCLFLLEGSYKDPIRIL